MSYVWPIALVVFSNVAYQICAKSVPKEVSPMASMTVTYFVGTVCSALMYVLLHRDGNLIYEYSRMNLAPALLGVSVVGLEVGFIYAYRAGWPVSTASIIQSSFLALILMFVGAVLYQEAITMNKVIGALICLVGLYFINR